MGSPRVCSSDARHVGSQRRTPPGWFAALLVAVALGASSPAAATTRASRSKAGKAKVQTKVRAKVQVKSRVKTANRPGKRLSRRAAAKAKAEARAKAEADAIAAGKAAVFAFEGDETEPLRMRVVRLLKANGMRVQTDLRPNDTSEQYRDLAATLNLAIYVHGRVKDTPGGRSLATVTIRSGVTGRTIARANFEGDRRALLAGVEEGLWTRVKAPLGRACMDALKPRRHNAPMRIEAGTPIEDSPRRVDGS
jgi:hypothetical protein